MGFLLDYKSHTLRLICSGVGGFCGSLPAERVARGGVIGLSAMFAGL